MDRTCLDIGRSGSVRLLWKPPKKKPAQLPERASRPGICGGSNLPQRKHYLNAVIEFEFYRVRRHVNALDFLSLHFNVRVDEIFGEHAAGSQVVMISFKAGQCFFQT